MVRNEDLKRVVLDRLESAPAPVAGAGSLRYWLATGEVLLDVLLATAHPGKAKDALSLFRTRAARGERDTQCALEIVDQRSVSDLTGRRSYLADHVANESVVDYAGAVKDLLTVLVSAHSAPELTTIRESLADAGSAGNPLATDLMTLLAAAIDRHPTSAHENPSNVFAAPMAFIPPITVESQTVHPSATATISERETRSWRRDLWIVGAATIVAIVGTVGAAFGTANHWTVVDAPEHPETYHSEDYTTAFFEVTSTDAYACSIGQDYQDCIDLLTAEYNDDCARYGDQLEARSRTYCAWYKEQIESMENQHAAPGSTLGGTSGMEKNLTSRPYTAKRELSNNDYQPASTHKAVCYLGSIGECP